ncbi:hypothetical protein J7J81_03455 [bacterium]|nr:hypothetical protein [bacterium]
MSSIFSKIFSKKQPSQNIFSKKNKFLLINIGANQIEGLIFNSSKKFLQIIDYKIEPIECFGVFESRDFNSDVIRKAFSALFDNLKIKKGEFSKVLVGLPPEILKARISYVDLHRTRDSIIDVKESEDILQFVYQESDKLYHRQILEKYKILPEDFLFLRRKILGIKINGYKVPAILGYKGKLLEFRVLSLFGFTEQVKRYQGFLKEFGFQDIEFFHESEGIVAELKRGQKFFGVLIDINSSSTQIFWIKNSALYWIGDFKIGDSLFQEALSKHFGMDKSLISELEGKFLEGKVSRGLQEELRELFAPLFFKWVTGLKQELASLEKLGFVPPQIFFFWGKSVVPILFQYLKKDIDWGGLMFSKNMKISFILPRNLQVKGPTAWLKNPGFTRTILLARASIYD